MGKKENKRQNHKKPQLKIIDYIDDMGARRRTYTKDKIVEIYIQNTYTIVKDHFSKNLTS